MKKRTVAAVMTAMLVLAMTGCANSGAKTESAAAATTQEAAEEVAAPQEWMNEPTAYLSGITAADYVDLPADYASMTVEVRVMSSISIMSEGLTEKNLTADPLKNTTLRSVPVPLLRALRTD